MRKTLFCMGIGAGLMYLFDPEMGEVRRSMLMDKLNGVAPKTQDALASKADAIASKASELTAVADSAAAESIDSLGADAIKPSDDSV